MWLKGLLGFVAMAHPLSPQISEAGGGWGPSEVPPRDPEAGEVVGDCQIQTEPGLLAFPWNATPTPMLSPPRFPQTMGYLIAVGYISLGEVATLLYDILENRSLKELLIVS